VFLNTQTDLNGCDTFSHQTDRKFRVENTQLGNSVEILIRYREEIDNHTCWKVLNDSVQNSIHAGINLLPGMKAQALAGTAPEVPVDTLLDFLFFQMVFQKLVNLVGRTLVLVLLPVDKVAQRKWFVVHISGHAIVDMEYHRQRAPCTT